jgi:hypothetical protein
VSFTTSVNRLHHRKQYAQNKEPQLIQALSAAMIGTQGQPQISDPTTTQSMLHNGC